MRQNYLNCPNPRQNCMIANNASRILNLECYGILRCGDIKSTKIFNRVYLYELLSCNCNCIQLIKPD